MEEATYRRVRATLTSLLSLCTGWWAALAHVPTSRPFNVTGEYSKTEWIINNTVNLGLVTLTIPWILCVQRDFSEAKRLKSPKPILAHIPCLIFIISWPYMYFPQFWLLAFFGVS